MLREAVVNAIRHSDAEHIQVKIHLIDQRLLITVHNDGVRTPLEDWQSGRGINHLKERAEQLNGSARWHQASPSTLDLTLDIGLGR